jgi:hypothetical protein
VNEAPTLMSSTMLRTASTLLQLHANVALGVLMLVLFALKLLTDIAAGQAGNSLWMCHVANLLLGIGLLAHAAALMRVAVLWIVFGIPLWILDMIYTGQVSIASMLAHLVGLAVSVYALRLVGMGRRAWLFALVLLLIVQQLCRWLTPPALNVNLAHRVYDGATDWFTAYLAYWTLTTVTAAVTLYLLERLLALRFPIPQPGGPHVDA